MVAFTFSKFLDSIRATNDTAESAISPTQPQLNQVEPINSQEQFNLELPESSISGDESTAGFDFADGGPGDATVAGIDFASPPDDGLNDRSFTEDEYGESGDAYGGEMDPAFAEDEYGGGGENISLSSGGVDNSPKKPRKNPLNIYTTYTYGLSLAYMTIKEYNSVVVRGAPWTPSKGQVLIASGGRRSPDFSRNPNFELDMYITDFKMSTIIGLNSSNKGTNAIDMEFTVHEPLGASFLENLVTVANQAGIKMWDQMPLVLQIDFFAINPDGSYAASPIPDVTKHLCIKIIDIKLAITQKGAEYKIRAIPQSHAALQNKSVTVPVNFEVTAKNVQEFFKSTGASDLQYDLPPYGTKPDAVNNPTRDESQTEAETRRLGINASPKPKSYGTLSLVDALNEYQKELVKKGYQGVADEYVFVIDPDIERATIFVKDFHNLTQAPAQNDKTPKDSLDQASGIIPINAGSNLIEVVNNIIRSSDYYRSQIIPPSNEMESQNEANVKSQPLNLHKIITTVEYLDQWDNKRKLYKKKITFNITKFKYHNQQFPNAKKSIPTVMDKEYNYIFMGKNQEIFDLKIEFNTLFFQSLTAFESKTAKDNLDTSNEYAFAEGIDPNQVRAASVGSNQSSSGSGGLQTLRIETTPTNRSHNQLNDGSKKSVQAVDLFNTVFNKSGADMVSIDLEIAGDPDLIKQDDVWIPPSSARSTTSLLMDKKQLFMQLNFKIPRDINLSTGLYEFENKNSAFSGIYSIIKVDNSFNNGVFKQKLKCVRLFDQPADTQNKKVSREENNPNRSISNPSLGIEDRENRVDSGFYENEYGEGGELIGGNPDATSSTEEFNPQTDFELANADIQSWPEEFAVDASLYPGSV